MAVTVEILRAKDALRMTRWFGSLRCRLSGVSAPHSGNFNTTCHPEERLSAEREAQRRTRRRISTATPTQDHPGRTFVVNDLNHNDGNTEPKTKNLLPTT
jgi:hypothetical protein